MGSEGSSPTPSPALAVVDIVGTVAVVHVRGELDMITCDAVERVVNRAVDGGPEAVVVDLSAVTFFGSSGLQMLAEARQHAGRGTCRCGWWPARPRCCGRWRSPA
jgi:anti-anti-sigma factor